MEKRKPSTVPRFYLQLMRSRRVSITCSKDRPHLNCTFFLVLLTLEQVLKVVVKANSMHWRLQTLLAAAALIAVSPARAFVVSSPLSAISRIAKVTVLFASMCLIATLYWVLQHASPWLKFYQNAARRGGRRCMF